MADVLVLAAHPQLEDSRVNRALMDAASALGAQHVTLRDLYALYPDYLIDVQAEQAVPQTLIVGLAATSAEALGWMNTFIIYAALPALFFKLVSRTPIEQLTRIDFIAACLAATYSIFVLVFVIGRYVRGNNIAESTVQALAGEGVDLVINARTKSELEATADEIRKKYGVKVTAVAVDVTTEDGRKQVLLLEAGGGVAPPPAARCSPCCCCPSACSP